MTTPDLSSYEPLFTSHDFGYTPDEMYCGHRVVDLRDGIITAKAFGFKKGTRLYHWEYASKYIEDMPGRAPELTQQKHGI